MDRTDWHPDVNVHHNYPPPQRASDQPQPVQEPPVEEPPLPDDWDDDPDEDEGEWQPAKARTWDDGWPGPEHWWP